MQNKHRHRCRTKTILQYNTTRNIPKPSTMPFIRDIQQNSCKWSQFEKQHHFQLFLLWKFSEANFSIHQTFDVKFNQMSEKKLCPVVLGSFIWNSFIISVEHIFMQKFPTFVFGRLKSYCFFKTVSKFLYMIHI